VFGRWKGSREKTEAGSRRGAAAECGKKESVRKWRYVEE